VSADEATIAQAVRALRAGELVVFPTETLYGVGCDATDARAVARLCAAKERGADKGFVAIVDGPGMLDRLTDEQSPVARALVAAFWPGPLTILFPARAGLPGALVVDGKVAARHSSHPVAVRLARELGRPVAAPSANPAGREPARDVAAARAYFGAAVACYIDGGPISGLPSTLVDPGPPLRVLREGAIPRTALEEALRGGARPT
jgi:tRNA threonylcarbamoyl adenosine modification protein (Sua5/YciO/YrdC/YwlC family)